MIQQVVNVVVAGLGGQGVIKASDILADVAFRAGLDVKKAEVHGMSQRGGSVRTDVRFGRSVLSPMIPRGAADFLVVIAPDQVDNHRYVLAPSGVLIAPADIALEQLSNRKSANVALLGLLSRHLEFSEPLWRDALAANLPGHLLAANLQAFAAGRQSPACGTVTRAPSPASAEGSPELLPHVRGAKQERAIHG
jgi:indolepyruvate ferredoxin oxidoreductase, beta subunit